MGLFPPPTILRFNELYAKAGGPKGHLVDREVFSKYFNLPVAVGDRLFDAFDEQQVKSIAVHGRSLFSRHCTYEESLENTAVAIEAPLTGIM